MMASRRSTRTVAIADRAQTPHDFALGIGLFIVAIGFTFAFIPTSLMFTGADPGPTEISQAERAATGLMTNLSDGEKLNRLNATTTVQYFTGRPSESELQADFGLPSRADINVTIRGLDDDAIIAIPDSDGTKIRLAGGEEYQVDRPAAESVRLVRIVLENRDCDPACKLVVRVW